MAFRIGSRQCQIDVHVVEDLVIDVYFVEGINFFPFMSMADLYMIDAVHPNDLGMYYMAKTVYEAVCEILSK